MVDTGEADIALLHQVVHGGPTVTVQTEGGPVDSAAKVIADMRAELEGEVADLNAAVLAAANSAATATTQAGIATTKAGESAASAAAALAAQLAAEAAATNAATYRDSALAYRNTAGTHASDASGFADVATNQAGISTTQAGISSAQATVATTKAGEAVVSAAAADASATTALGYKNTTYTYMGAASGSAAAALASQTAAAASETNAAASTDEATTAASDATTQAGISTAQATTATTQAGISTTKAGESSASAAAALVSQNAAAASAGAALGSQNAANASATAAANSAASIGLNPTFNSVTSQAATNLVLTANNGAGHSLILGKGGAGQGSALGTVFGTTYFMVNGSYTGTSSSVIGLNVDPTLTPGTATATGTIMSIAGTYNAPTGVASNVAGLRITAPAIQPGGGGSVTAGYTVLINGAPTGPLNSWALYVAGGTSYFGGIVSAATVTAPVTTDLVLNGGSSGASITLSQGANGNIKLNPTGTGVVYVGANAPSGDDTAFLVTRSTTGAGSHAYRDESAHNASAGGGGYASFDAATVVSGSAAYNHMAAYQSRQTYAGSVSIVEMRGFYSNPVHTGTGVVTYDKQIWLTSAGGTGPMTWDFGIYSDIGITRATNNFFLYHAGAAPSWLSGQLRIGLSANTNGAGSSDGHLSLQGPNTNKMLQIGYNSTGNYGWLQGSNFGSAVYAPIVLQANGSNVLIGTTVDMAGAGGLKVSGTIMTATVTAPVTTDLALNGGSSGASVTLVQGTNANANVTTTGTGAFHVTSAGSHIWLYGAGIYLGVASATGTLYTVYGNGTDTFINAAVSTGAIIFSAAGSEKARFSPSNYNLLIGTLTDMPGTKGLTVAGTTSSTSTTTGSIINAGGFGNAGQFHNGLQISLYGDVIASSGTNFTFYRNPTNNVALGFKDGSTLLGYAVTANHSFTWLFPVQAADTTDVAYGTLSTGGLIANGGASITKGLQSGGQIMGNVTVDSSTARVSGTNAAFTVGVTSTNTRDVLAFGDTSRVGLLRGFQNGGNNAYWEFGGYINAGAFVEHIRFETVVNSLTSGALKVFMTTGATNSSTGAFICSGGGSFAERLYVASGVFTNTVTAISGSLTLASGSNNTVSITCSATSRTRTTFDNSSSFSDFTMDVLGSAGAPAGSFLFSSSNGTVPVWQVLQNSPNISFLGKASVVKGFNTAVVAVSALDIDWALGNDFTKTLGANSTFTFSNLTEGQTINVTLTNTASNYTVTWPTVSWSGGVAPVQTVGAKSDVYTFKRVNGVTYGNVIQNF